VKTRLRIKNVSVHVYAYAMEEPMRRRSIDPENKSKMLLCNGLGDVWKKAMSSFCDFYTTRDLVAEEGVCRVCYSTCIKR
jgi:hypothetical protein